MTAPEPLNPPVADGGAAGPYADLDVPDPLERAFGDPDDRANPVGFAAFLEADERGDLPAAGERLLDRYGLGAEFVPVALGGRLDAADHLGRTLRPLFARDGALALGHGASNLVGAVNVWVDGDPAQRRWLADVLLAGGRVAAAYTDLDSGNDVARAGLRATPSGDRLLLTGRKEVVNNIGRAEALTVLARTDDEPGSRSHSLLLLDRAELPPDRVDLLHRYRTSAVRAMYLGGMAFRDCPVPRSSVVGPLGGALETVLRAFQVTRAVLPSASLGGMDTQLRTVVAFARNRHLYDRAVVDLPHARSVLARAFVDLLICDSLATCSCRALHVLPGVAGLYAAATKYLVPVLLREAVDELGVVLGARSFVRTGPHGVFQKHLRDLPVAALVHAGGTVCLSSIIPQLPRTARGWLSADEAGAALFRLDAALPTLDLGRLAVVARGDDALLAAAWAVRDRVPPGDPLRALCDDLVAQVGRLREHCLGLAPAQRTPLAAPGVFELARQYAVALAAAACLGTWWHQQEHPGAFVRNPAWVVLALDRLAGLSGRPARGRVPAEAVLPELLARADAGYAFDLVGRRLVRPRSDDRRG